MTGAQPAWPDGIAAVAHKTMQAIIAAATLEDLRQVEVRALGRQGEISLLMRQIPSIAPAERKVFGQFVNRLQQEAETALARRKEQLIQALIDAELADDTFDVTLPGIARPRGHLHPLSLVTDKVESVFTSMGFHVLDYPEVESEFNNFEALNIPSWHPARDMQDTFWLDDAHGATSTLLLRTHTSSGQVRAMHQFAPPFRAIFPGKVFRYEATDASHEHTFHQVEGLLIDRHVSVAHLLDSMRTLLSAILEREVEIRLRPGYFPFVEPGFELDISCQVCGAKGCSVCKQSGWLELLPCGLVHPQVLRAGGLDPAEWQGWAFGLGLSRLVMMRYGVPDVRLLLSGDARFLSAF